MRVRRMPEPREREFYVGYLPAAPKGIAARVRLAVLLVLSLAAALAIALPAGQNYFARSMFEYGVVREFEGLVSEHPYPMLLVPRAGLAGQSTVSSRYLVVVFGKRGGARILEGLDGQAVRLEGSLIYRDGRTMIQAESGTVEVLEGRDAARFRELEPAPDEELGRMTLSGEIVDSKCYLGVMKPGNLKPHRSCAVRCISGGIPPLLMVRDETGRAAYFLLVSEDGRPVNREVLHLVAEPVQITGRVVRRGGLLVLHADPTAYRRL